MKKINVLFILLLVFSITKAQKPFIQNYDEVVAKATSELDSSMQSGALKEFAVKRGIKGEYIMDITIHERGKVLTVYAVSNDTDDLKMQNRLKDFIRTMEFAFKVTKNKNYKFQYTFHFN